MKLDRKRLQVLALPSLAALGLALSLLSIFSSGKDRAQTPPRIPPPGPVSGRMGGVSAIGLVEAEGEQVGLGAFVSGVAAQVSAVPGRKVRSGEILFSLDTRAVAAEVATRKADLRVAEFRLAQARNAMPAVRAQVDAMRASVDEAAAALAEAQDLAKMADGVKIGSTLSVLETNRRHSEVAVTKARLEAARARLAQAQADLSQYATEQGADGPTVAVAAAAVEQARATVAQAETSLALHSVRAPYDATVLQVNIHPGEFVQAGVISTPLVVLGQLDTLRVRVELEEADIPRFNSSARAWASPRGAGDQRFALRALRVEPLVIAKKELTGAATERVDTRVLRVLYEVDSMGRALFPGQQMDVFIAGEGDEAVQANGEGSHR
jgi:multidrug resistance efflux pump